MSGPAVDVRPRGFLYVVTTLHLIGVVWVAALGWAELGSVEILRWPVAAIAWFTPLTWILRTSGFVRTVRRLPVAGFGLWALWATLSSTWSSDQGVAFAFGTGFICTGLASAWYGASWGWIQWARATAIGLSTFLGVGLLYSMMSDAAWAGGRFRGLSDNPTATGTLSFILVLCAIAGRPGNRLVLGSMIALGATAMYFAEARTAFVGLTVGLLFLAFHGTRLPGRLAILILAFVALVSAASLVSGDTSSADFAAREEGAGTQEVASLNGRAQVWSLVIDSIGDAPIVGQGLYGSRSLFGEFRRDGRLDWAASESHNLIGQVLLETGLVGVLVLGAGLASIVRSVSRARAVTIAALLVALAVNSMTESLIDTPTVSWVVLTGIAGAVNMLPLRAASQPKRLRRTLST